MILAKFRNKNGHGNMFRQQLESIFGTLFLPKPKSKPRPKKFILSLSQGQKNFLAHPECKPRMILGIFDGKYIEHENDSDKKSNNQEVPGILVCISRV